MVAKQLLKLIQDEYERLASVGLALAQQLGQGIAIETWQIRLGNLFAAV